MTFEQVRACSTGGKRSCSGVLMTVVTFPPVAPPLISADVLRWSALIPLLVFFPLLQPSPR